jgi:hypothetical protein
MNTKIMAGTLAGLLLGTGAATAASPWPSTVLGNWNVIANQSTLTLTISKESGPAPCKEITGTLVDSVNGPANIEGFYCNDSGRISFLRKSPTNSQTYQTWTGNLSYPGDNTYMAGVFEQEVEPTPGEYDFYAIFAPAN